MAVSPAARSLTQAGLAAAFVAAGLYVYGTQHAPDTARLWYFNDFKLPL